MEQIKDQRRLFEKLFISPMASPTTSGLILSMQFLKLLLEELPLLTSAGQKTLLLEVLKLFHHQPTNSLLLYAHDQAVVDQVPLLTLVVFACAKITKSRQESQQLLDLLDPMLSYYPISLLHISSITQELSIQFQSGNFKSIRSHFLHCILQKYYGRKSGLEEIPRNIFFFYNRSESSSIRSSEGMRLKIKNEIAVILSFSLLQIPSRGTGILWLATNHESLLLKVGNKIEIENQSTNHKIVEEEQLVVKKWYRLIVNLTSSETSIFLNGEEIFRQKKGLLKKEKQRQIRQYSIGEDFIGFIGTCLISDKAIPTQLVKDFPDIQKWGHITYLMEHKLSSSIAVSCIPFSTFQIRDVPHCFDIFHKHHSAIGDNIVNFKNPSTGMVYLGNYEILLPLFYLARFYNAKEYPDHLERLLKIWLASLEQFKDTDKSQQFLLILGHHLQALPNLLTQQCVSILSAIYERLNLTNKVLFLKHVGWSGLPGRSSGLGVTAWLHWLTKLYQNNKTQCLRSYGLLDVVFWLVKHLENSQQNCCPQHYLSEARVLRQFSLEQLSQIESLTKKPHFQAVENIAAVILEYSIIDNSEKAIKEVKGILRLLLHKYSNCLYTTILRILKRQIPKFRSDKQISGLLLTANVLPFLAALAEKIVDPSLLSLVVYLMLMVSQFKQGARVEVVEFIIIVLKRMHDIHNKRFNLMAHGAKKVRKHSQDLTRSGSEPLSQIVTHLKVYTEDFTEIKYLFVNCTLGVVSEGQLSKQNRLVGQQGFSLLKHLFPLVTVSVRIDILEMLKSKLFQHTSNSEFLQLSQGFNHLMLGVVGNGQKQQVKIAREIFVEVVQWQLRRQANISVNYIMLKNISRSQIDILYFMVDIFTDLCKKKYLFTTTQLYQILLIMTNQRIGKQPTKLYWQLITQLLTLISMQFRSSFHNYSVLSTNTDSVEFIEKIKALDPAILSESLFQLELHNISEEEVSFLFDILLPKVVANSDIITLLTEFKRQVYVFETYVYGMMHVIEHDLEKRSQFAMHLVEAVVAFISVALVKQSDQIDKSFMRMVLFTVSYFFTCIGQKDYIYILWHFIISFVQKYASKDGIKSYPQLSQMLLVSKTQPYLVQIFQIFLRLSNQEYLISFQKMAELQGEQSIKEFIDLKIIPVLELPQFRNILQSCKKYAQDQLYQKYQAQIKTQQYKMDIGQSKKPENDQSIFKAVQRIFEQESIGEEQTRLYFLHQHEGSLRKYHSLWNKIWKKLRIYHNPYGIYAAQRNSSNCFVLPDDPLKNYRFKISKYSSASGIQPILQAQIQQPWHVRRTLKRQGKNQLSSLAQLLRPSQAQRKKTQSVMTNLLKKIGYDIGPQRCNEFKVLWVKRGRKARGKLMLNDNSEIVFWYQSLKQEDTHLSFERFSLPFDKVMVKSWRLDCLRQICKRRYLMSYHALELVLLSRKSLLFYFEDHNDEQFLQQLTEFRSIRLQGNGAKLRLNRIPLYMQEWLSDGLSVKIVEQWRNRKISNLQYLMAVNRAASRGIYDISQYPVCPWVCCMGEQKQPIFRDLSKTMGGLGSQQRKLIVSEKYSASDPFNPVPPFYFGTHYSSPGVVFNYLIRLAPFTDYCKNLQGGKFDIPDRLFASLITAWKSATTEVSDVRELTPEFYYLPQCLLNSQRLRLGVTQSGQTVDHVQLPLWAAGNPYFLTTQLRQMIESEQATKSICEWINLIFGVKQRGQAAKDSFNVYYYLTYEDYSNCLTEEIDQVYRKSCEAQVVHFGQIPPQIFQKQHPKRLPLQFRPVQLRVRQKVVLLNNLKEKLIGIERTELELLLIKRDSIELLNTSKSPAVLTKVIEFNFQRTLSKLFFGMKKEAARVVFFRQFFLVYGYITNEFRIFNKTTGEMTFDFSMEAKIEHLIVNKQESLVIFGCSTGLLYIFELEYEGNRVTARKVYVEVLMHPISHLSQYDGFFTVSFGCFVSIYKFQRSLYYLSKSLSAPFVKFFRSFRNELPVRGAFIADIPLYCLVFYDNAHVKTYSINGQFIRSYACSPRSISRLKDRELNCLFCVNEQGRIVLLSTPDLRCVSELQLDNAVQVLDGAIIYQKEIHFIDC